VRLRYHARCLLDKLRLPTHACVLAGLLILGGAAHAQAGPTRGVALNWVRLAGAEGCISPVDLARQIEERLGRQVFSRTSDAILVIEGRVGPQRDGGFTAVIRVGDPDGRLYGTRELSVAEPDCRKLDTIVTLIISITLRRQGDSGIELPAAVAAALDALFADEPTDPDPATLPDADLSAPGGEVATVAPSAAADPALPPSVPAFQAQLEGGLAMFTGAAPASSFAPLLRPQLLLHGWASFGLEGRVAFAQDQRIASEPRGTLTYQSYALAAIACVRALEQVPSLWLCAHARLGSLSLTARDFVHSYAASQFWFEVAPVAQLRTPLAGPIYAQLGVGLPFRVLRPSFQFQDSEGELRDAFSLAIFGLDLSLSAGIQF